MHLKLIPCMLHTIEAPFSVAMKLLKSKKEKKPSKVMCLWNTVSTEPII